MGSYLIAAASAPIYTADPTIFQTASTRLTIEPIATMAGALTSVAPDLASEVVDLSGYDLGISDVVFISSGGGDSFSDLMAASAGDIAAQSFLVLMEAQDSARADLITIMNSKDLATTGQKPYDAYGDTVGVAGSAFQITVASDVIQEVIYYP